MASRFPVFLLSEEHVDPALCGKRYPRIESVRIIQKVRTPSAMVKIRRRYLTTGGPAVTRTYFIYSERWLAIWQNVQRAIFATSKGAP